MVRFYARTSRHTGVSVGIFGAIVLGFLYLLWLVIATVAVVAAVAVALAVKGVQALVRRQRAFQVLRQPRGAENGVQRPRQACYSDRR